jgi:hypothetical protein
LDLRVSAVNRQLETFRATDVETRRDLEQRLEQVETELRNTWAHFAAHRLRQLQVLAGPLR